MNQKLLIGAVVVVVVIGLFVLLMGSDTAEVVHKQQFEPTPTAAEVAEEVEDRKGVGTLEELRLMGEDIECTITYEPAAEADRVEGTYFVSEGEIRGDFLTESPDLSGQILSSMIMADGVLYAWSEIEGQQYGVRVSLDTLAAMEAEGQNTNQPLEMDQEISYECTPWENVDRTVFEPPSDVLFQDMSELMQAGMEYGTVYEGELGNVPGLEGFEMPDMPEMRR